MTVNSLSYFVLIVKFDGHIIPLLGHCIVTPTTGQNQNS